MLQEILLPKVTLSTFGALKGLLPSVFPAKRSHSECGGWADCPPHPHPVPTLAPSGTTGLVNQQAEPRNPSPPGSRSAGPPRNPALLCKGRNNPRGLTPRRNHSLCPEILWPPPSKPRPELTTLPRPRDPLVQPRQPLGGRLSLLPVSVPSQPRLARGALKMILLRLSSEPSRASIPP